jgi:hypothetical protein
MFETDVRLVFARHYPNLWEVSMGFCRGEVMPGMGPIIGAAQRGHWGVSPTDAGRQPPLSMKQDRGLLRHGRGSDAMDLTTAIVDFQQQALMSKIQIAVAGKVLDQEQTNGDAAVQLIQSAENGFDSSADVLSSAAIGLGGNLDVSG